MPPMACGSHRLGSPPNATPPSHRRFAFARASRLGQPAGSERGFSISRRRVPGPRRAGPSRPPAPGHGRGRGRTVSRPQACYLTPSAPRRPRGRPQNGLGSGLKAPGLAAKRRHLPGGARAGALPGRPGGALGRAPRPRLASRSPPPRPSSPTSPIRVPRPKSVPRRRRHRLTLRHEACVLHHRSDECAVRS